jgi:hypothetical protein
LKRKQTLGTNVINLDLCLSGCTKGGFHGMISREAIVEHRLGNHRGIVELMPAIGRLGDKAIIDYVTSLGITSIELLPIHFLPDDSHLLDNGLHNYLDTTRSPSSLRHPATTGQKVSLVSGTWFAPS